MLANLRWILALKASVTSVPNAFDSKRLGSSLKHCCHAEGESRTPPSFSNTTAATNDFREFSRDSRAAFIFSAAMVCWSLIHIIASLRRSSISILETSVKRCRL